MGAIAGEHGCDAISGRHRLDFVNPAVASPIIGARTFEQARDNLDAAEVELAPEHVDRLESG